MRFTVDPSSATLKDIMLRIQSDSFRAYWWISSYENNIKGPPIDLADPRIALRPLTAIVEHLLPEAAKRGPVSLVGVQTISLIVGDYTSVGLGVKAPRAQDEVVGANHAHDLVSPARAHAVGETQAASERAGVHPSAAQTNAKPNANASPIASAPAQHVWLLATPSGNHRPYNATLSAALEGLYMDFSAAPHATNPRLEADISGRKYRIDVARMTQTNTETRYVTQITRSAPLIDAGVVTVDTGNRGAWAARGGGVAEWSWEAPDGTLALYDAGISLALERLHADFRADPHRVTPTLVTTIGGVAYELNVEQMTQFDLAGGHEVPIFRTLRGRVLSTPSQSPPTSGASADVSSASTKASPCWSWETPSGRFKPYAADISAALEERYMRCLRTRASPIHDAFIGGARLCY